MEAVGWDSVRCVFAIPELLMVVAKPHRTRLAWETSSSSTSLSWALCLWQAWRLDLVSFNFRLEIMTASVSLAGSGFGRFKGFDNSIIKHSVGDQCLSVLISQPRVLQRMLSTFFSPRCGLRPLEC